MTRAEVFSKIARHSKSRVAQMAGDQSHHYGSPRRRSYPTRRKDQRGTGLRQNGSHPANDCE